MANGDIFQEIKAALLQDPHSMTIETRDRFVLTGMIKLYDKVDAIEKRQTPMYTFYKASVGLLSIVATLLIAFLWNVFTGQVKITFK